MTILRVLVDNTAHLPEMTCEHGLSMALEHAQELWIWDAGASNALVQNAALLGLGLGNIAGLALSHGHWDHTGGLQALRRAQLQAGGEPFKVYAHPDALLTRYSLRPGHPVRDISWRGGDESASLHTVQTREQLAQGLEMHTAIPRQEGRFQAVEHFALDRAGARPDAVRDDAALLVEGEFGPSLILGCCHSGLANTLDALRERTAVERLHAVVGGLHLMQGPESAVQETAKALRDFKVQAVYAGHCTGDEALSELRRLLPGKVHGLGGGRTIQL